MLHIFDISHFHPLRLPRKGVQINIRFVIVRDKHFFHTGEGGTNISYTQEGGGQTFFTHRGGQTFYFGGGGAYDDVVEEMDVS